MEAGLTGCTVFIPSGENLDIFSPTTVYATIALRSASCVKPLFDRICCARTRVLLTRRLFLTNVIVDPLENWSETELPSCDGLHHELVRSQ